MKSLDSYNHRWLSRLGYAGLTVWPFIFYAGSSAGPRLRNHEAIHYRQQVELGVLPFFLLYGLEYLVRLCRHRNHGKAYRSISFEREAFDNDDDLEYLTIRKRWAWVKYV